VGIENNVHFLDFREDIPQILNEVDLVIIPSRQEAFGRIAIEAMAASKPVVAFRIGGIPEIVIDNKTGFLVDPEDIMELGSSINHMFEKPLLRIKYGEAGYREAVDKFSIKSTVSRITEIYYQLLNERNIDDTFRGISN